MTLMVKKLLGISAVLMGLSMNSAFSAEVAAEVVPFDNATDCAAQPYGGTPGFQPLAGQDELMPELHSSASPEYLPAEMVKDLFIQLAQPVLGAHAEEMNAAMSGLCISKQNRTIHVSLYFKQVYTLELKPFGQAVAMETYQAVFPTLLRVKVEKYGNYVEAYFSGRYLDTLRLKTKIPVLSDWVYLHHLTINTETKVLRIGAGAMKDRVKVVAWSKFVEGGPLVAKIALGSTLGRLFRRGW